VTPVEMSIRWVRSQKQLDRVLDEIEEAPGIVLFTLWKRICRRLEAKCQQINSTEPVDHRPVMNCFRPIWVPPPPARVGAQHV